MINKLSAEELARIWIEYWNEGRPDDIPLAEDFKHTSPFGQVQGRQEYLQWVKPLAAKNVADLTIKRIIVAGDEAAIHFEMQTPEGPVQVCDWVSVHMGLITEIYSFYDARNLI